MRQSKTLVLNLFVAATTHWTGLCFADDTPSPCLNGTLTPVSGRIFNNSVSATETLGSLHLTLGTGSKQLKLKCGLHGSARPPLPTDPFPLPRFLHTLVCDDTQILSSLTETIHSQAVMESRFVAFTPIASCGTSPAFIFREETLPRSGRGLFSPTGGGTVSVSGIAQCSGAIDMVFSGMVCVNQ